MQRLIEGYLRFQREIYPHHRERFVQLRRSQQPEVLLITCADSRIDPCWVTQSLPGDLFICRNAGNIVPAHGDPMGGVSATIEYAVLALNVKDIIVCGHSDCGAMRAVLQGGDLSNMPAVSAWMQHARGAQAVVAENYAQLEGEDLLRALIEENVLAQIRNLETHPSVAARLRKGSLHVHGWMYDIESGQVDAFNPIEHRFIALNQMPPPTMAITTVDQSRSVFG